MSVKLFIYGLGNLGFKHILLKLSTKFCMSMQLSNNLVVKQCFKSFKYSDNLSSLVVCHDGVKT